MHTVKFCSVFLKPVYSDTTQLDVELLTLSQREQLSPINERIVIQLTQFVGHDVINKNKTDLAVRCSTGSVELS